MAASDDPTVPHRSPPCLTVHISPATADLVRRRNPRSLSPAAQADRSVASKSGTSAIFILRCISAPGNDRLIEAPVASDQRSHILSAVAHSSRIDRLQHNGRCDTVEATETQRRAHESRHDARLRSQAKLAASAGLPVKQSSYTGRALPGLRSRPGCWYCRPQLRSLYTPLNH